MKSVVSGSVEGPDGVQGAVLEFRPDDEMVEDAIQQQIDTVGPILAEMFKRAATRSDYWLKGKYLQELCDWIITVQNMASMVQPLAEEIAALRAHIEQLEGDKPKVWVPT